jgi:hypothetical protein
MKKRGRRQKSRKEKKADSNRKIRQNRGFYAAYNQKIASPFKEFSERI